MKLIVGLGNPGDKYRNNRHNVGFCVVDAMANGRSKEAKLSLWLMVNKLESEIFENKPNFVFAKPTTFMNNSGRAVKKLINHYSLNINHLCVVHDDLDIPLGQFKIQKDRGPKVHNGVNSIEEALGTNEFWRVRVGVDNRDPDNRTPGEKYVLEDFTSEEMEIVNRVIKNIAEDLLK